MRKSVVLGLLAIAISLSTPMWGTSLVVGGTISSFPSVDLSTDTLLAHTCSTDSFPAVNPTVSGKLCAAVFKEQNGFLDFAFQVTNLGPDPISKIWMTDLTGFTMDVFFSTTTGGNLDFTVTPPITNPLIADRPSGSTVEFFFLNPPIQLASGASSSIIVIKTNATAYTSGTQFAANGNTIHDGAFAPTTPPPVPEPATMILVGLGVTAGALRRRMRRA